MHNDFDITQLTDQDVARFTKQDAAIVALKQIRKSIDQVIDLLTADGGVDAGSLRLATDMLRDLSPMSDDAEWVGEGVFDGEKMIGHDGTAYEVPQNYASKSKLIEGDILKMTQTKRGDRIFKQISPVERRRIVGTLAIDEMSGQYYVMADDVVYKVIPASVTYFRGGVGDEVIILVPRDGTSAWAAVENIIKR